MPVPSSSAFLPEGGSLRRLPRDPWRSRPAAFLDRFESLALVYDAFWHVDGKRILLVGPPPLNLGTAFRAARFTALPDRTPLVASFHTTLSVMVTELHGASPDTTAIVMTLAGDDYSLPVGANFSPALAGGRVLFSMNRDNDLAWIAEWAGFHARRHATDVCVLFDNGSSRYEAREVEATLAAVPGLRHVLVPSWPWRFGALDGAVRVNPFWSHFLQNASMSVVLRRFGAAAFGLLNCDVDELATSRSGRSPYDLAASSRGGLLSFSGEWVEGVPRADSPRAQLSHRDFVRQATDPAQRLSAPRKWALDPSRAWVGDLNVQPYWHWIANRPWFSKTSSQDAYYLHFKGINTHWKEDRGPVAAGQADSRENPALVTLFNP